MRNASSESAIQNARMSCLWFFVNGMMAISFELFRLERRLKRKEKTMKKEYNLKKLTKRPGKTKVDPDSVKVPISLRLDATVLAMLKTESDKRGLPYQTLIGSILHQFVHGELIDRKTIEILKKLKAS